VTQPEAAGAERAPEHRAVLGNVVRGGAFALAGTASAAVMGFALTLVVTRGLTKSEAGEFFTTTALFLVLLAFTAFGVAAGVVRFVPRFLVHDRGEDVRKLLVVAVVPVLVASVVMSVVLWLSADSLSHRFSDGSDTTATAFRVLALFLVPGVLEVVAVESTRAFGDVTSYVSIQQFLLPLARPVLVGLAIAAGSPLAVIVAAWSVPLVITLVLSAFVLVRAMGRTLAGIDPSRTPSGYRTIAREYWAFTLPRGLSATIDIVLTWLDVLLVAAMVSAAQAAIYAAASRFITTGTLALAAMRLAAAPEISAAMAADDKARASDLYRVTTQLVILASWPLYLLLALFAPGILLLFGPGYDQGAPALAVLSIAMLVPLAAGNVGSVLLLGGKSTWVLLDKIAVLAVNIGFNLVLIPRFGILGAAIAWALSIVLDNVLAVIQVHRGLRVSSRGPGMVHSMVLALGVFGGIGLVVRLLLGPTLVGLAVTVVVAGLVYLPLVRRSREALELSILGDALRSRGKAAKA
jgi:O-antigen/teichoic acid export membrane protein